MYIDVPDSMSGRSIMPLVNHTVDKNEWPSEVYIEICNNFLHRSVRTKRWKYDIKATTTFEENKGKPDAYVEHELYDLKADPWELNNLIGYKLHDLVMKKMRERLVSHMKSLGEMAKIIKSQSVTSGQKMLKDKEAEE